MNLGKPPWTFDEHNQADHLIDADGNHIGDMRTPELAAIAVAAVNTAAASYDNARKAALWDRLLAIWRTDDGEPTKAYDHEVLERVAMLVNEWEHGTPAPLEVCDPVDPPQGAVPFETQTRTAAHEAFYENDTPAPPVPGEFSNVFECKACEGNVAAGKTCHRCGRKGPLGQGIDWTAGIGRMAEIKAVGEAIVASAAPGPISTLTDEMRSMLAQAARLADALKVSAELAEDLRSDLRINLNKMLPGKPQP